MAELKGTIGGAAELGGSLAPVGGYSASMRGAIGPISDSIRDGAVTTPKLADLAVTTAKIADAAVTLAKLASEVIDATLSVTGAAADAKATGDALALKAAAADLTALANSLGDAAYYDVANNLTTATAGSYVLDAAQGKVLSDSIKSIKDVFFVDPTTSTSIDSIRTAGLYCGGFGSSPSTTGYGFLIVSPFPSGNNVLQLFYAQKWNGNVDVFYRTSNGANAWYAWKSLTTANTVIQDTLTTATPCANNSFLNVANIAHEAGTYVVFGYVSFASSASGARSMMVTTSATGSSAINTSARARVAPVNGAETTFGCSCIVRPSTAGSWYLRVWQNSGAALNVTGAQLVAVKLSD